MPFNTLLIAALLVIAPAIHAANPPKGIQLVVESTANVSLFGVRLADTPEGLQVSGWVKRRYPTAGRLRGIIEVSVLDDSGRVLADGSVTLRTHHTIPRHQRLIAFSVTIPEIPAEARVVRVLPDAWGPAL